MKTSTSKTAPDACLAVLSKVIAGLSELPLHGEDGLDKAGALIAGAAAGVLGGGRAAVALLDPAQSALTLLAAAGEDAKAALVGTRFRADEHVHVIEHLLQSRTAAPADLTLAQGLAGLARALFGPGEHLAPMAAGVFRRGVLSGIVFHAGLDAPMDQEASRRLLLVSLADLAALALEAGERERESRARMESEERLAALLHALPDQVCFKDARGRWIVANRAWIEAHGVDGQDYRGMTGASPDPDMDVDGVPTALRLKTDAAAWILGSTGYCLVKRGPGGREEALEVLKKAIGPRKQPRGLMVAARNVTSHRQALEELRASNTELEAVTAELQSLNESLEERVLAATRENRSKDALLVQQSRMAAMGEMIGIIAHQWRQPLNALGLLVTNMTLDAADGALDEAQAMAYDRQCRSILNSMSRTIDEFRDFFKPDRTPQTFTLDEPVREALSLVRASLVLHGIVVEENHEDPPRVCGLKGELSQVALNLLVNARDAVAASGRRRGRITIRTASEGDEAVLSVADDGGGVPPEAAPHLFDPYFTTKGRESGTGLGLYISRRIVEDHMRGRIGFDNHQGGAVFTVRLPLGSPARGGSR